MAKEGEILSGAIIFQTRRGWSFGGESEGSDMGIVRNGGRTTFNYWAHGPIIYADAKEVVLMVPRDAK